MVAPYDSSHPSLLIMLAVVFQQFSLTLSLPDVRVGPEVVTDPAFLVTRYVVCTHVHTWRV